jgi:hypothetical protein
MKKLIIFALMLSVATDVLADKKPTKQEQKLFNVTRAYLLDQDFCQDCAAAGAWLFIKHPESKCAQRITQNTTPPRELSDSGMLLPLSNEKFSDLCTDEYDKYVN